MKKLSKKMRTKNKAFLSEVILYLLFGALTTVLSLAVYYACFWLIGLNYQICNVISWCVGVTFAYITNRKYVFRSGRSLKQILKFWLVRFLSLVLETAMLYILVKKALFNPTIAKPLTQGVVIILNYVFSKLFVFS